MRIAVAQIGPVVGAFEANVRKILDVHAHAVAAKADLMVTPELAVCGYPPHDLVERPEMFERNEKALADLASATKSSSTALAVGHIGRNPSESGRGAFNQVTVLERGKRVFSQAKSLLPTYDIFDESRYFEPAERVQLWEFQGRRVALAICEDLWAGDSVRGRHLYGSGPIECFVREKAELVISISASPYEWMKRERRESVHAEVARKVGAPLLYVNQVGATDEVLFDGGSFALDSQGKGLGRLPLFKPAFGVFEWGGGNGAGGGNGQARGGVGWVSPDAKGREDTAPIEIEVLHRALVTGIREYFAATGFKKAILGLSGGIDSAVVATLAAQALGPANVIGVAMPSQFSSGGSLADAEQLARNLGVLLQVRPIKFAYSTLSRELADGLADGKTELAPVALENLQSRLRGLILMTLSNHSGALVLTTGNKSEMATGYCTLYGDMAGALAPIGDLFKTRVYELARFINSRYGELIPPSSINKAPSAELRPDQKDQDTLPAYSELDGILEEYLERGVSASALQKKFTWVGEVLRRVELNEYKRRQAAPVLKTSPKAFGIGRRMPIARRWEVP